MTRRLFPPMLFLALLLGCTQYRQTPQRALEARAQAAAVPAGDRTGAPHRDLVKTVELDLRVADTARSAGEAQGLAADLGGYVGDMAAQRQGEVLYYTLTLRIPVDRLNDAVARLKSLANRIDREVLRAEDVTEQHIDLAARLKTLEATETELRGLLSESRHDGRKTDDIMSLYGKLTEIRSGIEQIQGQLEALEKLAALSTIKLQLWPTDLAVPVAEVWHPGETVRSSVRTLLAAFRGLGNLAIVGIILVLPLGLLLGIPIWWLAHWWTKLARPRVPPIP